MRLYNSSRFYLFKKNEEEWDYFISSTPLTLSAISGVLNLHQNEYNYIILKLEKCAEGLTFKIDGHDYGILYADEIEVPIKCKIGTTAIDPNENRIILEVKPKNKDNIANKFINRREN